MAIVTEKESFLGAVELITALEKDCGITDGQCQTRCSCGQDEVWSEEPGVSHQVCPSRGGTPHWITSGWQGQQPLLSFCPWCARNHRHYCPSAWPLCEVSICKYWTPSKYWASTSPSALHGPYPLLITALWDGNVITRLCVQGHWVSWEGSEPGQTADSECRTPNGRAAVPWCFSGNMRHLTSFLSQLVLLQLCGTIHTWKWRKCALRDFRAFPMDRKVEMMSPGFEPGSVWIWSTPRLTMWLLTVSLLLVTDTTWLLPESRCSDSPTSRDTEIILVRNCLSYLHLFFLQRKHEMCDSPTSLMNLILYPNLDSNSKLSFHMFPYLKCVWALRSLSHKGRY